MATASKTYLTWIQIKTTPSFNYKSFCFHGNVHIIHVQEYSAPSSQKSNNERENWQQPLKTYLLWVEKKTTLSFYYKSFSFHENVDPVQIIHVQEYSASSSQKPNNERENWQQPLKTYLTWIQIKTTPSFYYKSFSFHENVDPVQIIHVQEYSAPSSQNSNSNLYHLICHEGNM